MLREMTWTEVIADMDGETSAMLAGLLDEDGTDALVLFENQQMDSSEFGRRSFVAVGPERTYRTVEACEGQWLNDLPSQRQYARAFVRKQEVMA